MKTITILVRRSDKYVKYYSDTFRCFLSGIALNDRAVSGQKHVNVSLGMREISVIRYNDMYSTFSIKVAQRFWLYRALGVTETSGKSIINLKIIFAENYL